jgi:hypothetical protein
MYGSAGRNDARSDCGSSIIGSLGNYDSSSNRERRWIVRIQSQFCFDNYAVGLLECIANTTSNFALKFYNRQYWRNKPMMQEHWWFPAVLCSTTRIRISSP